MWFSSESFWQNLTHSFWPLTQMGAPVNLYLHPLNFLQLSSDFCKFSRHHLRPWSVAPDVERFDPRGRDLDLCGLQLTSRVTPQRPSSAMPEVYLRTVGSSIAGHPGLTPDAGCWGKGGPGWPGSHPLFIPQQPNRGHNASTAPPSVSLPGVRSVRRIMGSQRGAGTNPNLRPIRDAVVWRKCPATSVLLCKEGRDGAVEVNLRFQSVLGNREIFMDSLGTSNWCEDPNLWVCHYYQQSLHKWQPTDILSQFHPKIWILKSLSLSLLTYASITWRQGKGYNKKYLFRKPQEIHDSDHLVINSFWDQIVNSIDSVTWWQEKKWIGQNVTLCLLTCDGELHCLCLARR